MNKDECEKLLDSLKSGDEVLVYPTNRVNPIKAVFIESYKQSRYNSYRYFYLNIMGSTAAFKNQSFTYRYWLKNKYILNNDRNVRRFSFDTIKDLKIERRLEDRK